MNAPLKMNAVVARIATADICASPSNPRKHFDETYIAGLAETIKQHDVIQPITVRPNPRYDSTGFVEQEPLYELVVGECRWRAAKLAGLLDIPAFWRELDDKQVLEIQVIENLQRQDVHPLEEAEGYEMLMTRHGYKAEQIADKIGKSKAYVYARMKLTALCPKAREAFYDGKFDASTALLIARIPGSKLQEKALTTITLSSNGNMGDVMSYRQAKNFVHREFMIDLANATFSLKDAKLLPDAGACTACPKRTGSNPDLFGDVERADVCTDTKCFDDKRAARHLQLIDNAEKNKVKVIRGDEAKKLMPHPYYTHIDTDNFIDLDATVEDDAEGRSYRDILGKAVPIAAAIEHQGHGGQKTLVEVGNPKALAAALKKAGWSPKVENADPVGSAERQRKAAERDARIAQEQAEREARIDLRDAISEALRTPGCVNEAPTMVLHAVLAAWVTSAFVSKQFIDDEYKRIGFVLPADYEPNAETQRLAQHLSKMELSELTAFVFEQLASDELTPYGLYTPAFMLNGFAEAIGLDTRGFLPRIETAPDPTLAAQAQEQSDLEPRPDVRYALWGPSGWTGWSGKGRKPNWINDWLANGKTLADLEAETKTDLASTSSPNEPTITPEVMSEEPRASVEKRLAWPFPAEAEQDEVAP